MKLSRPSGKIRLTCYFLYAVLPLLGYFIFGIWGAIAGLVLAFFSDFLVPVWASELEWDDVDRILENMRLLCPVGAKGFFKFGEKKFYVTKIELGSRRKVLALSFRPSEWHRDTLKHIKNRCVLHEEHVGGILDRYLLVERPQIEDGGNLPIKPFFEINRLNLESCMIHVDYAKGNVYRNIPNITNSELDNPIYAAEKSENHQ